MDEMRHKIYQSSKRMSLEDLPPTSHSTRGHILRACYATYIMINCLLTAPNTEPRQFGYEIVNWLLIPITFHRLVSDELVQNHLTCTTYVRASCLCKANNVFVLQLLQLP